MKDFLKDLFLPDGFILKFVHQVFCYPLFILFLSF